MRFTSASAQRGSELIPGLLSWIPSPIAALCRFKGALLSNGAVAVLKAGNAMRAESGEVEMQLLLVLFYLLVP